jgi:hypothetical protein
LAKRRATYDDLLNVPDHLVAEILDGELYATPRPDAPHALAASALGVEIGGPFQSGRGGPGGWWILDEPELHLGADVVVPDLAGWRRSTLPQIPNASAISVRPRLGLRDPVALDRSDRPRGEAPHLPTRALDAPGRRRNPRSIPTTL